MRIDPAKERYRVETFDLTDTLVAAAFFETHEEAYRYAADQVEKRGYYRATITTRGLQVSDLKIKCHHKRKVSQVGCIACDSQAEGDKIAAENRRLREEEVNDG
jgi:hypothetical protein